MKKILLFLVLMQLVCLKGFANSGDTLVIKAHENVVIQTDSSSPTHPPAGFIDYPVIAHFPATGTQYYKIYAYLTFECAPGLMCGEWDYINHFRLGRLGGSPDPINWELGRFITPYGKSWNSGMNWKHGWYYDLTDFAPLLHDDVEIIYKHTGYEARDDRGWKINLTFFCIEGTPPLEIVNLDTVWNGSFKYGDPADPIENHLNLRNISLNPDTRIANLKIIQTGHGMDQPDNCAEFCPRQRTVKMDNNIIDQRDIWKLCGFNSLFPQAGTWLYDRTNWCPGQSVQNHDIYINNLAGGTSHDFDIDMQPYTFTGGSVGNWVFSTYLVEYAEPTYTNDVSIEAVIAPSKEYEFLRLNPICGSPIIVIKNNGKNPLTTATIVYGVQGEQKSTFNWTGSLAMLQTDTVRLSQPMKWGGGNVFEVEVQSPNGATDEFIYTNKTVVPFDKTDVINDNKMIVVLRTNAAASENYYYLRDVATNSIVHKKEGLNDNTTYRDTIMLTPGNCYSFEFYDDGPAVNSLNNDGLAWWANTDGSGSVRINNGQGQTVKQFNADFGTKILYQFTALFPVGVNETIPQTQKFDIYPNPSNGIFTLEYQSESKNTTVEVFSITGTKVFSSTLNQYSGASNIDLSNKAKGIYLLKISAPNKESVLRKIILQ